MSSPDTAASTGGSCREDDRLRDRARGALLGAAAGDGLGAPFEGAAHVDPHDVHALEADGGVLRHTDDTAMLLVLAEQLGWAGTPGDLDPATLVRAFAEAWRAEPWRGYGSAPPRIFTLVGQGVPWQEAALRAFDGQGSYGNGGAMRVAPVALATEDLPTVVELARRSAAVTHAHPLGQEGAVLQAVAVALALRSDPHRPVEPDAFLDAVTAHLTEPAFVDRVEEVRRVPAATTPAAAASALGNGIAALDSVPLALLAFLQHPDRPDEAVRFAIAAGGDTDTTAAMAGAIAGARAGVSALPPQWLRRLEAGEQLTRLADLLVERRGRIR